MVQSLICPLVGADARASRANMAESEDDTSSAGGVALVAEADDQSGQEETDIFLHGESNTAAGDALFRALAPRNSSRRQSPEDFGGASLALMLASSQAKNVASNRQRQSTMLSVKEDLGRQYLVARRLAGDRRDWAQAWAREHHADRFRGQHELNNFLQCVRRYARDIAKGQDMQGEDEPAEKSQQGLRRAGGALGQGACTVMVPTSKRRRRHGGGGPGTMKCPELGAELFNWFVDSLQNIKGRIPSFLLLDVARVLCKDLQQWHEERKERGEVAPHSQLDLPVLNHAWLRRWRRLHHISWRTVNLRFKCSRAVLKFRLGIFWCNVLRVRFLHQFLEADGELVFEGMDQKPLWFTASSQEKSLALKGARKVAVKENVPMTRARFTAMTRCRWPRPPQDEKSIAVLFKAAGGGARIRAGLRVPHGVLLQFAEKGSYRLPNVLEYFEWILDRSRGQASLQPVSGAADYNRSTAVDATLQEGRTVAHESDAVRASQEHLDTTNVDLDGKPRVSEEQSRSTSSGSGLQPRRSERRVVYLLDWFAPHHNPTLDDLVHSAGHAVLRVGGHLTGLVQVEDTHAHGPYTAEYKRCETEDAYQQLLVRPDRLPSTSRQTVLDRAVQAWDNVNHESCSYGFVQNGIANALNGDEDGDLSPDVADFWAELQMSAKRTAIREEVRAALASGQVTQFEDYWKLLKPYDDHAYMQEGEEAFGVSIDEVGAAQVDSGSGTDENQAIDVEDKESDDEGKTHAPPLTQISSHGADAGSRASQLVVVSASDVVPQQSQELEAHPMAGKASEALAHSVAKKREATLAALQAAQSMGGDAQLVETLQQRLRSLAKQAVAVGSAARVHLHSKQLERQEEVRRLRVESKAQETKEKELALTVKLRKAEAEIAKAKGKEAAALAKKAAEDARLQAKAEARLREAAKEKEEALRLRFAAHLAGRLNEYLREGSAGQERRARAARLAGHAARRRVGLRCMPVPRFWPATTLGLKQISTATTMRLRGKQEVLWASPDFSWMLFGRAQHKQDDPRHSFCQLVDRLMPDYFAVLNARYGVEGLLAESHRVLDLAFVAANWRYTQVVGAQYYRMGLHAWPPEDGWDGKQQVSPDKPAGAVSAATALSHGPAAPAAAPPASSHAPAAKPGASSHGAGDKEKSAATALSHGDDQTALSSSAAVTLATTADPRASADTDAGSGAAEHLLIEWTVGADGEPVRTEAGMRLFLSHHGLRVKPSDTHGVNNCLIDSVLLALSHAGIARADMSLDVRRDACAATRRHLVDTAHAPEMAYLSHHEMLGHIFNYLREHQGHLFRDAANAGRIALTVSVIDRFSVRAHLLPCEPVFVPAMVPDHVIHVQLQLYCCTNLDGTGFHYEWIAAAGESAQGTDEGL